MNKAIGISLIVVGILTLLWAELGPSAKDKAVAESVVLVTSDKDKTTNWPLYIGGFCLVSGIVVIILSKKEDRPY